MKPAEARPPPLPGQGGPPVRRQSLRSLALLLGLVLLAGVALQLELPLPSCPLRTHTGVPCPFCGSTRAFAALARLDFVSALEFNPLMSVAACAAGMLWGLGAMRADQPGLRLRSWLGRRPLAKWLLAGALALNWLYLWLHLPR